VEYFSGYEFIKLVQSFSNSFFDIFFKYITMLGDEIFYLIFIPIIYLCFDKVIGLNLITFYLVSSISNTYLKDFFHTLRPSPEKVRVLLEMDSYAFPSGHAQGAVVFWGYLFSEVKRNWLKIMLIIIISLVSLSRIYLGVHFPIDVFGGWIIGFLILIVLLSIIKKYRVWEILSKYDKRYINNKRLSNDKEYLSNRGYFYHNYLIPTLIIIIPLILFFIYPTYSTGQIIGILSGIILGATFEKRYIDFNPKAKLYIQVIKIIIALSVAVIIRIGLKEILPVADFFTYIRYFVMGLWLTFLMPFIIKKAEWEVK